MNFSLFDILVFPPIDFYGLLIRSIFGLICVIQPKKEIIGGRYIGFTLGLLGGFAGFIVWLAYLSKINNDWSIMFGSLTMAERKRRAGWAVAVLLIGAYLIYAFDNAPDNRTNAERALDNYCTSQGRSGCSDTARELQRIGNQ